MTGPSGLMKFSNGDVYQGPWREGSMDGAGGTMTYWDGRVYTGDWRRNVRHGRGVMLYTNGDKYEGEWNQGVRQGQGALTVAETGSRFSGEWLEDGLPFGVEEHPSGDVYEGPFTGAHGHSIARHGHGTLRI
eukprot:tig00000841_g4729.t1